MTVFAKGDEVEVEVEVCSKQEGFLGSHYEATVISALNNKSLYKVRYKNLVQEEDHARPLIEIVSAYEVRPMPPTTTAKEATRIFRYNDTVDAFHEDGWWVGKISGKQGLKEYLVYFDTYGQEIAYPVSHLRKHLEWRHERWVSCTTSFFSRSVLRYGFRVSCTTSFFS